MKNFILMAVSILAIEVCQAQSPDYGNNPRAGQYIVLNGVRHYYEVYGSGKPVLLIHGNSTPTRGWAPQISYLSKKYKVYSIDGRARGKSDFGNDTLTYFQQAKDAAQFIEQLKLDSVNVIGKSDGAIIALLMAIHFPKHLGKIVSFSANLWPDTTALYSETVAEIHGQRILAEKKLAEKDTTKDWRKEQQLNRMMEFQPHISASDLQKIQVPVLVLSCDRDVIQEEHTFFIYKNIRLANLCIMPNQKHGFPKNDPDLFNQTVERYLETPYRGRSYRFEK